MHRGRNCPRVTAQFLSVNCVVPQFAPERVRGFCYVGVLGVETAIEFHSNVDAVVDLAGLTITWRGPSRFFLTDGDFVLVQGYDSTTGCNRFFFRNNFSDGARLDVVMAPSFPFGWSPIHPVALPDQLVTHLPVILSSYNGIDFWPVLYF